jgi:hypothetical protein
MAHPQVTGDHNNGSQEIARRLFEPTPAGACNSSNSTRSLRPFVRVKHPRTTPPIPTPTSVLCTSKSFSELGWTGGWLACSVAHELMEQRNTKGITGPRLSRLSDQLGWVLLTPCRWSPWCALCYHLRVAKCTRRPCLGPSLVLRTLRASTRQRHKGTQLEQVSV